MESASGPLRTFVVFVAKVRFAPTANPKGAKACQLTCDHTRWPRETTKGPEMDKPPTQFTKAGDVAIAYQVVGDGPVDLVYASGWLHNIDIVWEHSGYNRFLSRLSERCRLILFDKRGTGMSDRDVGAPTLEERTDDIRAVMNAVGSEKASIFGISEGGNMTTMFAATYPERVSSIVLVSCKPCKAWKPDWPHGLKRAAFEIDMEDFIAVCVRSADGRRWQRSLAGRWH